MHWRHTRHWITLTGWPECTTHRAGAPPGARTSAVGQQADIWLRRPVALWQPGETCFVVQVVRGLHLWLGQEQQVPDVQAGSALDHGRKEGPANSGAASLGPDGQRTDLGLCRARHDLAALRPELEHDGADEPALVTVDGHQHRAEAVGAELAQTCGA